MSHWCNGAFRFLTGGQAGCPGHCEEWDVRGWKVGTCVSPKTKACLLQASGTLWLNIPISASHLFLNLFFSPFLVFLSMMEQNTLFRREELSAQKPTVSRDLKREPTRLTGLAL